MPAVTVPGLRQTTAGGGHQYWIGDEGPFPGVTSIIKAGDTGGSDSLINWAVNTALEAAFDEYERSADRSVAHAAGHLARNAARDLGTNVHRVIEAINTGAPFETTERTAPFAAQYAAFLVRHRVDILAAEGIVVNRTHRYGGSFDLLARVDGRLSLLDVKTGRASKETLSHRLQLGAYQRAELTGAPGDEPVPMPAVDATYVLALRPDGFELIEHRVTDADWDHFLYLADFYHGVRNWTKAQSAKEAA